MKTVYSEAEARQWFLANSDGSVRCGSPSGAKKVVSSYLEAARFFSESASKTPIYDEQEYSCCITLRNRVLHPNGINSVWKEIHASSGESVMECMEKAVEEAVPYLTEFKFAGIHVVDRRGQLVMKLGELGMAKHKDGAIS